MMTAMTSLESMIDVNTIVGDCVTSPDGTIIIPVSKISFGFAAGGSEFNSNKESKNSENQNSPLPFGGGSGAGVNISPMAFLVVKDGITKLVTLDGVTSVDKLIDLIPDIFDKTNALFDKSMKKPKQTLKITHEENRSPSDEL